MEPDRLEEGGGTGQQATGPDCKSNIGTEVEACQKAPVPNDKLILCKSIMDRLQ